MAELGLEPESSLPAMLCFWCPRGLLELVCDPHRKEGTLGPHLLGLLGLDPHPSLQKEGDAEVDGSGAENSMQAGAQF